MLTELSTVQKIVAWSLPVIFAITLHEVAHGWVANKLGDPTACAMGRLSWNPLRHIDLLGTIILPLLLLSLSNFCFGWAKPVPVNERNLRKHDRDLALVALAGPIANLIMAIIWAAIAKLGLYLETIDNDYLGSPLLAMGMAGIMINVVLAVLNLLPVPPLDGSKLLYSVLPARWLVYLGQFGASGFWLLVILSMTGVLGAILNPPIKFISLFLIRIFALDY
jgi:Zn-dependent protease